MGEKLISAELETLFRRLFYATIIVPFFTAVGLGFVLLLTKYFNLFSMFSVEYLLSTIDTAFDVWSLALNYSIGLLLFTLIKMFYKLINKSNKKTEEAT